MKTLTNLIESRNNDLNENFESNPGNGLKQGVTNHLTPVSNIITNVRNLFAPAMQIIVEPGEDGVSMKLHSSKFVSPEEINKILDTPCMGSTLRNYIFQQGLDSIKLVNLGMYYVVYCYPSDVVTKNASCANAVCTEMLQINIDECELETLTESSVDDEELEDKTKQQLIKFIDGTDKVKCAAKLAELLADDLELPSDYYFKGVKDTDGNESIALRYKFTKRRPFGKEVQLSKSLLNIYKSGDEAVWVEAFLTRDKNSEEMNNIVDTVLKLIGATPTDDPCVWAITPSTIDDMKDDIKDDDKNDEDNDDDLNKSENTEDISSSLKKSEEEKKYII